MIRRRGSILILALWIIAILSIIVLSFATEAHIETGINVYVRERNRVNRLIEAGQALGEIVLLGYSSVKDWSADQDLAAELEEDRWFVEKQELKTYGRTTIGGEVPILLDADDPESGTLKVDLRSITSMGGGDSSTGQGVINVNNLCKVGGDSRYQDRWFIIFASHNIPEKLATEKDGEIPLWELLIASWDDWRDSDDTTTSVEGMDINPSEIEEYEEYEEKYNISDEDRKRPRNDKIADIKELGFVKGFRDYPQVLYGGVINPWERKEDQITVTGILDVLSTEGGTKINVNDANVATLITIPGVFSAIDDPDKIGEVIEDATLNAQALIDGKKVEPDYDHDETLSEWIYKDWQDITKRLQDNADANIGSEAGQYFEYKPDQKTIYRMTITGESMGMTRKVSAKCYINNKTIRYIEWSEDIEEQNDEANRRQAVSEEPAKRNRDGVSKADNSKRNNPGSRSNSRR